MAIEETGSSPQQRRFFRVAVDFPVTITVSDTEEAIEGNAVDLSGGGMRAIAKHDLAAGQNVTLRFSLPESGEIMVRARVVLSFYDGSKQQFAHGVAFTQIAAADQSAIVDYIHSLQQRANA